ncbi:hypothetical protein EV702DRAFT_1050996 [Suillus placidus]|uniref:Uncharacterized protein n=1 Tax=Suillus placidus TaxID=48579 RepID=A0A9P6ZHN4_9AGAM|nr:hypothetical protein EV702DRAFT_1050996 [Suillus placidus]
MPLPTVDETCRGKASDGSQCPCLRPKIRKDQKDDEPVEAILQQPPSTSSSFGSIMSKYSHLLSKSGACEEVARRETNLGFRKQDTALLASTSHTAKVGVRSGSSIGSIVMVTVGLNRKGCMKRKVAPDTAKIEDLRKLKLAVSKGTDDKDLQIAGDGFYWYLIVKSGKNMVKSSQEGLTGNDVLKTRHPAGRKWSDQFIYFGTILEVDPESFSDLTSEVESLDEDIVGGSDDMDESETYAQIPISKNELGLAPSCLPLSNRTRTRTQMLYWWKTMNWTGLGQSGRRESANDLEPQSAEEPASNTPPAEEASTHVMLDQDDYEPYNISDFGAPNELLPFTSTPAAATTSTSSLTTNHVPALLSESHVTHKDLGSGFPQGLQAFHSTPRFLSSRSGFNMLIKPRHNPWDRK